MTDKAGPTMAILTAGLGAGGPKKKKKKKNSIETAGGVEADLISLNRVTEEKVFLPSSRSSKEREGLGADGPVASRVENRYPAEEVHLNLQQTGMMLSDDDVEEDSLSDHENRDEKSQESQPVSKVGKAHHDEVDGHGGKSEDNASPANNVLWLIICFFGIMGSFIAYGILLEYTTSGGRKLHELSFLFVTSAFYTLTGAIGSNIRGEEPSTIPPARFAVLGLTSMGSTFCSVRSLRYVIFPIQVLAKSCKPVPVMIMGAFMGKKYSIQKYLNVCLIVGGVALFMSGGSSKHKGGADDVGGTGEQLIGIILLFISLCFDGGTGAYEDKLMSVHSVGPFDLMYNIQLGKTILAGLGLVIFNEIHIFFRMVEEMGFLLVALGLSGAMGQIFIFVTISKFGALTCSIIGLARKVTTLVASIYIYGHVLNGTQWLGLVICVGAMVLNFMSKKKGGGHGHGGGHEGENKSDDAPNSKVAQDDEQVSMLDAVDGQAEQGDVELGSRSK